MRERFLSVLVIIVFFLCCIGSVTAAGKGNPRKGKYLFRKHCRVCHKEGATGERVGKPLSPNSKTQAEWKKVFDTYNQLACKDVWEKLSDKDRQDIFSYAHGHAFDSPSPVKCQ